MRGAKVSSSDTTGREARWDFKTQVQVVNLSKINKISIKN
jgi:hypothetical protein